MNLSSTNAGYDQRIMASDPFTAYHPLSRCISRALRGSCRVAEGDCLLLAVSGGADSTALMHVLAALATRRRWNLRLAVAHVHHHLHEQADAHAGQVAARCEAMGIAFNILHVEPGLEAGNLEAAARRLRYKALADLARRIDAHALVTAHHADDQLETMLMRMLRGTSVRGLAGLRPRRRIPDAADQWLIRPMLGADRAMVLDYLQQRSLSWCEDPTNLALAPWRGHLRRTVLDGLRALRPDVAQQAVHLSAHLADVERVLEKQADGFLARMDITTHPPHPIPRAALRRLNPAVAFKVVARLLTDQPTMRQLRPLLRAVNDTRGGERTFHFSCGRRAVIAGDTLTIHVPAPAPPGS